MTKVLGIDPSTLATGLALPNGSFTTIAPTSKADENAQRLHELYSTLRTVVSHMEIDVAVMEDVMATGGPQAIARKRLSELRGVFLLALFEFCIPVVDIHPTSLKKYATGNGNAQKHDIVKEAKNQGARVHNDNEADAHFLKKIGDDYYNLPTSHWHSLEDYQKDLHSRLQFPKL